MSTEMKRTVAAHKRWEESTGRSRTDGVLVFKRPGNPMVRRELRALYQTSPLRAWAASLGVCWAAGGNLYRPVKHYTGNPGQYGEAVYNTLVVKREWTEDEVEDLGCQVFATCIDPDGFGEALKVAMGNLAGSEEEHEE